MAVARLFNSNDERFSLRLDDGCARRSRKSIALIKLKRKFEPRAGSVHHGAAGLFKIFTHESGRARRIRKPFQLRQLSPAQLDGSTAYFPRTQGLH